MKPFQLFNNKRWNHSVVWLGCAALLAVVSTTPPGLAQDASAERNVNGHEVLVGPDNRVEIHVVDVPVSTVLRMLSMQTRRNMIVSPSVEGTVTADLHSVTFNEALNAILYPLGCDFRVNPADGFIHVMTRQEAGAYTFEPKTEKEFNEGIKVWPDGLISLHLSNVPAPTALRMLAREAEENIIVSPNVEGIVSADLHKVEFEVALKAILFPIGCGYLPAAKDGFLYVMPQDELSERKYKQPGEFRRVEVISLQHISAKDILPLVEPLLSPKQKAAAKTSAERDTDAQRNLAAELLGSAGSRFVESVATARDVGSIAAPPAVEDSLQQFYGADEPALVAIPSGDSKTKSGEDGLVLAGREAILVYDYPERIEQIKEVIAQLDVPPQQVLVEATILRAQLTEDNALGIDFNVLTGVDFEMLQASSPGVTNISVGDIPQEELNNTNMTFRTDFNGLVPPGGFTFGIVKDQVAAFVRALESVTDTTVIANPKVLALNRQEGEVIVGRRDGYITTTFTDTIASQSVEFLETGTQLTFRPYICGQDLIRMDIHPEDSSGGLNDANLPFKATTEVTTSIMVRDGHTILIGGLFRESSTATRSQIPLAGNIPLAGALFRNTNDFTEREEVIILLTVRIVNTDYYAEKSEEAAQGTEKVRVAMRRGLQPHGRERIAMAHYEWAVEHYEAGNFDKALWDARMALHLNPTFLPAVRLKEELQAREISEADGSIVRDFINRKLKQQDPDEVIATPVKETRP